jgi:O-antigen/teichoic acid export membrane protein
MDQGLFAGSGFILFVLLARWMPLETYGAFATAFAVHGLIVAIYESILTEPMLVFGPGRYQKDFSQYLGTLLLGHLAFSLVGGLTLVLAYAILDRLGQYELAHALLALGLVQPFVLLRWFTRKSCYATNVPRVAALAGVLYMISLVGGLYGLQAAGEISNVTAFALIGAATLISSTYVMMSIPPVLTGLRTSGLLSEVVQDHWSYSRWSVGSSVLRWAPGNVYYFVLPLWVGLEANGAFRALINLCLPLTQTYNTFSRLLVPALVRARENRGRFRQLVHQGMILFILGGVLHWIVLSALSEPLVAWLYGGKYSEHAYLLIILALSPIAKGFTAVSGASFRANIRPDLEFWAFVAASGALLLSLALVVLYGLRGAAVSFVLTDVAAACTLAWIMLVHSPAITSRI